MRGRHSFPISVLVYLVLSGSASAQWTKVTTLPPAAYINAVTAAGSSIVAASLEGVYTSTDQGASWHFDGLEGHYPVVNAVLNAGSVTWAGTSSGVFASIDAGASWTGVSTNLGQTYIYSVGSIGPVVLVGASNGVYRTTNSGTSWQHSVSDSPTVVVSSFAHIGTYLFAGTGGGVLVSRDSGQSWTLSSSGLTNLNVHGLAVEGPKVFAGTWGSGVFVSADSGASWTASNTGLVGDRIIENMYATDTTAYASTGNYNVFVSRDSGATWSETATIPFGEAHDCVVAGGMLFLATRSGVYSSTNDGTSWTFSSTGMNTINVGGFAASGTNVYIATNYNGIFGSTDEGSTWNTVNGNLPYIPLGYCIAVQGSNLYFGDNSGMHRSTDAGTTWQSANTGFAAYNPVYDFLSTGSSLYSAGSDGVYVSTDSAATWTPDTVGLPTHYVTGLGQSGSNLYTFPYQDGVYKSTDNGSSWSAANTGIAVPVEVNGFAKIDNALFLGASNGIYVSTNEGGTWATTGQFANTSIKCLTRVGLYLIASTQTGLYVSGDKAQTWQSVGTGLGTFAVNVGHIVLSDSTLLVSVNSDGVWERSLASVVPFVSAGVASVAFPHVRIPDSSSTTLRFRNVIGHPLSVTSLSVGHPSVFSLSTAGPFSLATVDSFTVTVTFKPSVIGSVTDTLTISYTGGTAAFPVTGYGTGTPTAQIAHRTVNFGTVKVGQFKDTTVTITNGGNDTLIVGGTTSSSSLFVARNVSLKVPPGHAVNDTLRFVPSSAGPDSGSFVLTSNAATSRDTIYVSGTGSPATGVEAGEANIPTVYSLGQNYPNPFNPSTTIPFGLPVRSVVRLKVYNILGQQVAEFVNSEESAGYHSILWNANVSSGIYFYRLEATSLDASGRRFVAVRKLVLLK